MMRSRCIAALLATVVLAACSGHGTVRNKAGAQVRADGVVIHLEDPDGGSVEALYFASQVKLESHGAVTVAIRQNYPATLPSNEVRLARALRAGRVSFGLLPGRAWRASGAPAFAALQAPFVLTSYAAARRAVGGPAGVLLKAALVRGGVAPLALVPTEMRRLLTDEPVLTPAEFAHQRIRVNDDPTIASVIRALGGQPVEGIDNNTVRSDLSVGRLDGVETAPIWAVRNNYARDAKHMTGYALFDRVDTLVASPAAWARLSGGAQDAVRAAADDLVAYAGSLQTRDDRELTVLCDDGVQVDEPTSTQLLALAAATARVRDALGADATTGPILRMLEETPGAGPRPLPPPAACNAPTDTTSQPNSAANLPEGTYVITTTRQDYQDGGVFSGEWTAPAYTWTTTLHDGQWVRTVTPRFPGQPTDVDGAGTYVVDGDQVAFSYTYPAIDASPTEVLRWSYYRGLLTLHDVDVADDGARVIYTTHPWRRVH